MENNPGIGYLKDYFKSSTPYIESYLNTQGALARELGKLPEDLVEDFRLLLSKGKRLRGALISLAYEAFGGTDLEAIHDLSIFIELFHSGILVHDDFMDNDPFRRGVESVHKKYERKGVEELHVKQEARRYGESVAVCLGDASFFMSWEKILQSKFSEALKVKASSIYSHYMIRLVHGQLLDITITGAKELKEEEVLNVIWTKSGEYTSLLPMLIGATMAGADLESEKVAALKEYAKCFGWAFHIQDDILGTFGQEEELGKPVGSDLREGKNTLFMLHLAKNGTAEQIAYKESLIGNNQITPADVAKMQQILKETGSYEHVVNLGWKYVEEGEKYVEKFTSDPRLQEIFKSLLRYMMERTK